MPDHSAAGESFRHTMSRFRVIGRLQGSGDGYLTYLENVFKDRAKSLRHALAGLGHQRKLSEVHEALAKTVGFPNLHGLQQLVGRLGAELHGKDFSRIHEYVDSHAGDPEALIPLDLLTLELRGTVPLVDADVDTIAAQVDHVAKHLGLPAEVVKDAVAVAWAGEPTWERLKTRTPLDRPLAEPVYTFTVDDDPRGKGGTVGCFHLSAEGQWIWDNVLGSEPGRAQDSAKDFEHALAIAQKCPGFFIALSAAAGALEGAADSDDAEKSQAAYALQRTLVNRAIKQAESLIPKGFKGTISWRHLDNRPYLRLLYQKFELDLQGKYTIRTGEARRVAQKLLRLNPGDNQGMRDFMPLLDAMSAVSDAVLERSCARALKTASPSSFLYVGLAELWRRRSSGMATFLQALFRYPQFGSFLLADEAVRPLEHLLMPSGYEDPYSQCILAYRALDMDPRWGEWVMAVLRDPELLHEERRVYALLGGREHRSMQRFQEWDREVPAAAARIAAMLLRRYPLPGSPKKFHL